MCWQKKWKGTHKFVYSLIKPVKLWFKFTLSIKALTRSHRAWCQITGMSSFTSGSAVDTCTFHKVCNLPGIWYQKHWRHMCSILSCWCLNMIMSLCHLVAWSATALCVDRCVDLKQLGIIRHYTPLFPHRYVWSDIPLFWNPCVWNFHTKFVSIIIYT